MLPFSLGSALVAVISGQIVARTGKYRPVIWFGFVCLRGFRMDVNKSNDEARLGRHDAWLRPHGHARR